VWYSATREAKLKTQTHSTNSLKLGFNSKRKILFRKQNSQFDLLNRSENNLNSVLVQDLNQLINIDLVPRLKFQSKSVENEISISNFTFSTSQVQSTSSLSSLILDDNGSINEIETLTTSLKFSNSYRLRKLTEILFYLNSNLKTSNLKKSKDLLENIDKSLQLYKKFTHDLVKGYLNVKNQTLFNKKSTRFFSKYSEINNSFSDMINYNSSNFGYNKKLKSDTKILNNGKFVSLIIKNFIILTYN
jgi:hypothetical protein